MRNIFCNKIIAIVSIFLVMSVCFFTNSAKAEAIDINDNVIVSELDVTIKTRTVERAKSCDKIGSVGKYVTGFYNILRYIAPALIVIFSIIEFLGVVFSGEEDKMEKAKKHFMIRLIVGVLLLLIPVLLEFILKMAGIIDGTLADAACNFLN